MYSAKYNVMDRGRMKAFALPTSYVVYDLETSTKFEDGGEIVERGNQEELIKMDGLYAKLYKGI